MTGLENDKIEKEVRKKLNKAKVRIRHIPYDNTMKSEIKLYRWIELDTVMELKSEPFIFERDAQHFAYAFQDKFGYEPTVVEENFKFYVYTGWILKEGFMSYGLNQGYEYFMCPNYS